MAGFGSSSRRQQEGNSLPLAATVNVEVAIQRKDDAIGNKLGHTDKTGVRQGHGETRIPAHQGRDGGEVFFQPEAQIDNTAVHKAQDAVHSPVGAAGKETCFRRVFMGIPPGYYHYFRSW